MQTGKGWISVITRLLDAKFSHCKNLGPLGYPCGEEWAVRQSPDFLNDVIKMEWEWYSHPTPKAVMEDQAVGRTLLWIYDSVTEKNSSDSEEFEEDAFLFFGGFIRAVRDEVDLNNDPNFVDLSNLIDPSGYPVVICNNYNFFDYLRVVAAIEDGVTGDEKEGNRHVSS